ncbi:hypothetical protein [Haemophilus parahaemolyticus]
MKPTFKTTALAILVSLGITSCGSNSDSSATASQSTPVRSSQLEKREEPIKSSQSEKTEKSEQSSNLSQPEQSSNLSQPEQSSNPSQPEQSSNLSQPEQSSNPSQPEQSSQEAQPTKPTVLGANGDNSDLNIVVPPTKPTVSVITPKDYDFIATSTLPSNDGQWRNVDLNDAERQSGFDKPYYVFSLLSDDKSFGEGILDLNTLSKNSLGLHKGKTTVNGKENGKEIDYVFVNQPYSSYGMVTGNPMAPVADLNSLTTAGFYTGYTDKPFEEYEKGVENMIMRNDGRVTYQGSLVAAAYNGDRLLMSPREDGKIKLNIDLSNESKGSLRGEINSKTIGDVVLVGFNPYHGSDVSFERGKEQIGIGGYNIKYAGKDYSEAVGELDVRTSPEKTGKLGKFDNIDIDKYQAVFGGQKQ